MASFGSLALVTHPGIRSLGELLLVGVFFTLLANLVVLPALIAGSRPARGAAAAGSGTGA
jgi:predicted RND superfamily exporter protein